MHQTKPRSHSLTPKHQTHMDHHLESICQETEQALERLRNDLKKVNNHIEIHKKRKRDLEKELATLKRRRTNILMDQKKAEELIIQAVERAIESSSKVESYRFFSLDQRLSLRQALLVTPTLLAILAPKLQNLGADGLCAEDEASLKLSDDEKLAAKRLGIRWPSVGCVELE